MDWSRAIKLSFVGSRELANTSWTIRRTENIGIGKGEKYYFNETTGETRWETPEELVGVEDLHGE